MTVDPTSKERCIKNKIYTWDGTLWKSEGTACLALPAPKPTKFETQFSTGGFEWKSSDVLVVPNWAIEYGGDPAAELRKDFGMIAGGEIFIGVLLIFVIVLLFVNLKKLYSHHNSFADAADEPQIAPANPEEAQP